MKDRLRAGESLNVGDSLASRNGKVQLVLQKDRNFVLYQQPGARVLWATDKHVGGTRVTMQKDGNLVYYDAKNNPLWAASYEGMALVPGAFLVLQDDGNAVIYRPRQKIGGVSLWSTQTNGFQLGIGSGQFKSSNDLGSFIGNAVKAAGRGIGSAIAFVDDVTGKIDKAITSVPFIGPALHAVASILTEEYQIGIAIAKGTRLDQVFVDTIHREVSDYKAVAPYVQMVISNVPGIGPEISAGISAGLALAQGQPIDEVMLAAAEGALPGGPMVKMVFDAAKGAVSAAIKGEDIATAAINTGIQALGGVVALPDAAKDLLRTGLMVAKDVAQGKKPDQAVISESIKLLPKEAQPVAQAAISIAGGANVGNTLIQAALKTIPVDDTQRKQLSTGLSTAIALQHGQNLQSSMSVGLTNPSTTNMLESVGQKVSAADPIAGAGNDITSASNFGADSSPNARGYRIGVGLMQHRIGIFDFTQIRSTLSADEKKGFDMAVSLHVGRVIARPAHVTAISTSSKVRAGYLITKGMMRAPASNKAAMMKAVALHPQARDGAVAAIKSIAHLRESLLARVANWFGF